jgi:hypothetical protein
VTVTAKPPCRFTGRILLFNTFFDKTRNVHYYFTFLHCKIITVACYIAANLVEWILSKHNGKLVHSTHVFTETHKPLELELELIQTQMAQKPMLRAEVGMRVHCANKASAE